jgi:hypothetical protein
MEWGLGWGQAEQVVELGNAICLVLEMDWLIFLKKNGLRFLFPGPLLFERWSSNVA